MTNNIEAKLSKMREEYALLRSTKQRAEEILARMPDSIERARYQGYIDNLQRQMDYIKTDADRLKLGEAYKPVEGSIACIECGSRVYSCQHIVGKSVLIDGKRV